jgi:hypothetical protein
MPLDVLHLARTTKQFRRVLMHKSSLSVWMSARANVMGFPDCPPSMAEPKFANLAFDHHCHVCNVWPLSLHCVTMLPGVSPPKYSDH